MATNPAVTQTLQSVMLFQHHQTTTPYAPTIGTSSTAFVTPATINEEEQENGEEHQ